MKKKLLTIAMSLALVVALFLTGCVNQGMADKINEKAKSDEGYTYVQLLEDYKNPTMDATTNVPVVGRSGLVVYVKGCKNSDEAEEKYNAGEQLDAVYVIIALNKVVSAEFTQYAPEKE